MKKSNIKRIDNQTLAIIYVRGGFFNREKKTTFSLFNYIRGIFFLIEGKALTIFFFKIKFFIWC